MVETRYQVFVSSTYDDLKDERREAIIGLLAARAIPAGMELFHASNDAQWEYIRRVIDECDFYVVIAGGRMGSPSGDGRSYTEKEFDYARELGKPILGFVKHLKAIDGDLIDADRAAIDAFRARVADGRTVEFFDTPRELRGLVATAYMSERERVQAVGWVRGNQVVTPETSAEVAQLRLRVHELEANGRLPPTLDDLAAMDESYTFTIYDQPEHPFQGQDGLDSERFTASWKSIILAVCRCLARGGDKTGQDLSSFIAHHFRGGDCIGEQALDTIIAQTEAHGLIAPDFDKFGLTAKGAEWLRENLVVRTSRKAGST